MVRLSGSFPICNDVIELTLELWIQIHSTNLFEKFNVNMKNYKFTGVITGSMVLKEQSTHQPVEGGLMYSGSNFYLGFD